MYNPKRQATAAAMALNLNCIILAERYTQAQSTAKSGISHKLCKAIWYLKRV